MKHTESNIKWTLLLILITDVCKQSIAAQQLNTSQSFAEGEKEQGISPLEATQLSYFDINLLEVTGNSNKLNNIVLSPASIRTVLGLLLHGAEGSTASELQTTLNLSDNKRKAEHQLLEVHREIMLMSQNFPVKSANALFFANELQPKKEFKEYVERQYFSTIGRINVNDPLSAINKINNWINEETEGLIPTAVTPGLLTQETKLIAVNALHFKAKWLNTFPNEATRPQLFYATESDTKCVQMMSIKAVLTHSYEDDIDADLVQIPFHNTNYTFTIILPRNKYGIQKLQSDLKNISVIDFLSDQESSEITLSLPRFTAEFETELTDKLKYLGTKEIFENTAKLPNIIKDQENINVDAIVHKAFVKINEEGAKAGAATVAAVVPLMSPSENIDIVVDHPFIFFIYHSNSNLILFEGRINQPEEVNNIECRSIQNQKPIKTVLAGIYNTNRQQLKKPGTSMISSKETQKSTEKTNSQTKPNGGPIKIEETYTSVSTGQHPIFMPDQQIPNAQQNINLAEILPHTSQMPMSAGNPQNVNYDKHRPQTEISPKSD